MFVVGLDLDLDLDVIESVDDADRFCHLAYFCRTCYTSIYEYSFWIEDASSATSACIANDFLPEGELLSQ